MRAGTVPRLCGCRIQRSLRKTVPALSSSPISAALEQLSRLPPLDSYNLRLLTRQDGRCPICRDPLLTADQPQTPAEWEQWWLSVVRRAIAADYLVHHDGRGTPDGTRTRLIHASCRRELQARKRRMPALAAPQGLA
jgi:hypothetical protein